MPIKSSIGQAHTCRHTQSLARIYQLNMKKEKWKFQRAASSRLKSKQPKNKKKPKEEEEEERSESCGLKLRCLAAIFTHGFYFFVFILLISLSHLKLCCCFFLIMRIYPFIVHLDKEFNKIEYLQKPKNYWFFGFVSLLLSSDIVFSLSFHWSH